MHIIFAGTPEFAKIILTKILTHPQVTLEAVFTQPDRPKGRGQHLLACPTKLLAQSHALPVYQYVNLKTSENNTAVLSLPWHKIDLLITAAYGLILPPYLLALPKYGCWNIHASLLPRWRGASPIQQALLAGDLQTGITLMQMGEGLDDGDMLEQAICPILPNDTYGSLEQKLAHLGAHLLSHELTHFIQNPLHYLQSKSVKQDNTLITYAPKITKEEAHLDWSLAAAQLERKIRAFDPSPGCFVMYQAQRIKIWHARVLPSNLPLTENLNQPNLSPPTPGTILHLSSEGLTIQAGDHSLLQITHCQLPGKNKTAVREIINGHPNFFILNALLN